MAAQDRIQELETAEDRHMRELQQLRDQGTNASHDRSHALQTAQARGEELERQEQMSRDSERQLQKELHELHSQVMGLQRDLEAQKERAETESESWRQQQQTLEASKSKAEDQTKSLERTIAHLKEAEGTLSGKELQLQRALESEKQRFEEELAVLQQDLDEANEAREEQRQALKETNAELKKARLALDAGKKSESESQDQIQALEDEIEVLQSDMDEDVERMNQDLDAAKQQAEGLRRQLKGLQQDLAQSQAEHESARNELRTLQTSRASLSQKVHAAQSDLAKAQKEVRSLHGQLERSETDVQSLQSSVAELEAAQAASEKAVREAKSQVASTQRENDRKMASQVADYERDIRNLEQDLEDADAKAAMLSKKQEAGDSHVARLKSRLAAVETDLVAARSDKGVGSSPGATTSVKEQERKDLHEMLKDAKVTAEDLAVQLREKEVRVDGAAKRERELRTQIKTVREERASQSRRADDAFAQLATLQDEHDALAEQLHFLSQRPQPTGKRNEPSAQLEKKHALELRGLVRQIEYLSARCRREEAFRADLSYAKSWFLRVLEMHARCNRLDLDIVGSMGIPVARVLGDEMGKAGGRDVVGRIDGGLTGEGAFVGKKQGRGRVAREKLLTLRVVGRMVLAGVRIRRAAEQWKGVKGRHEAVVRKLGSVRRERQKGKGGALGRSK